MFKQTVSAAYNLVLEQLKAGLDTLKEECCKTASDNQGLIRANLDQITSSQSFLVDKIQGTGAPLVTYYNYVSRQYSKN